MLGPAPFPRKKTEAMVAKETTEPIPVSVTVPEQVSERLPFGDHSGAKGGHRVWPPG